MRRSKIRGISLAIAMLLLLVLSIFTLTLGSIGIHNLRLVKNFYFRTAARYAALAGINECASMLYENPSWNAGFTDQRLMSADGAFDVTFSRSSPVYSLNNFYGTGAETGYGGVCVPAGFAHIVSKGTVNGCVEIMAATIRRPIPGPAWKYAVFADKDIVFKGGGSVKSFDSSLGSFPYPVQSNGGDVGTNLAGAGSVHFGGTADVYGNVFVGPGANVMTAVDPPGGGSHIKGGGTAQTLPGVQQLPKISDFVQSRDLGSRTYSGGGDYGTLPPGKYDELNILGNGTLHLTSGNYSFSRVSQAASARLQIDGTSSAAVRIYVRGTPDTNDVDIDISGGGVQNTSYKPTSCFIYGGTWVTSVKFTGSSQGYWAMYVPQADAVQCGTQDAWGGVICRSYLQTGNGSVKYDRNLARVVDTGSGIFPQIVSLYNLESGQ